MIKPGAKACNILTNVNNHGKVAILMLGSNDVYANEANNLIRVLKKYLYTNIHSDTILCTIPTRYDLPRWSIVNNEIRKTNTRLVKLSKVFKKVTILDISNLGTKFHTFHGQHFNRMGKMYIRDGIVELLVKIIEKGKLETGKPITLALTIQGN
jgi:hypothetical protein